MDLTNYSVLATKRKVSGGDVIIGASLGPVFTTCSPTYFIILATVLPQSFLVGLLDLVAYAVGLSGMVLLVAFLGQKVVNRLGVFSDPRGIFKKVLGIIFLIIGVLILFGFDKVLETKLLDSGIFDITKVEQKLLELNNKPSVRLEDQLKDLPAQTCNATSCLPTVNLNETTTNVVSTTSVIQKIQKSQDARPKGIPAPEITNPSDFINTDGKPITISQFRNKKVVLIDFWTYSCINCQRSLPYVNAWYDKYKDQGLEVIGIHTPEFAFEKVKENVEKATKRFGVKYPVVMDNNYGTWGAFDNNSWPRKYLIDENGEIIYDHIGEGEYDTTELVIQNALKNLHANDQMTVSKGIVAPTNAIDPSTIKVGSPEVYFGSGRNQYLSNGQKRTTGVQQFTIPQTIFKNSLYLGGAWNIQNEYAEGQ